MFVEDIVTFFAPIFFTFYLERRTSPLEKKLTVMREFNVKQVFHLQQFVSLFFDRFP